MLGASVLASVAGGGRIKTLLLTPASSLAAAQVSEASGRLLPSQMNSCQLLLSAVTLLAGAQLYIRLIMEVRIFQSGLWWRVKPSPTLWLVYGWRDWKLAVSQLECAAIYSLQLLRKQNSVSFSSFLPRTGVLSGPNIRNKASLSKFCHPRQLCH